MEKIIVDGGYPLSGTIEISGMKNAAVAVVFASIAARGVCEIHNLPGISDVRDCLDILESIGAKVQMLSETSARIDTTYIEDVERACKGNKSP